MFLIGGLVGDHAFADEALHLLHDDVGTFGVVEVHVGHGRAEK